MNLVALFEEALEFQNFNGTVLSNGKVKVYYIGRTSLADIYNDVAGEYPSENPRILDNLGMGPIYVNPAFDYEIVVYDEYDNELFSVKKYLHSSGAHSTSNVEVVPSENIQVSAWTQGDVQVYMPYITGNLGKVYSGIEPIVVNNDEDKISANHVPLGLQEPLYFVEDSESACIIGCSTQSEIPSAISGKWEEASNVVIENSAQWGIPEGTMNESAFTYDDSNNITAYNGSAFKAGDEFPESATEAINVVTANSAKWNGPYIPRGTGNISQVESLTQGFRNSAIYWSMAQGEENKASYRSLAQGSYNTAIYWSMAQGVYNHAHDNSMAQGEHNSAFMRSIAQGYGNSAMNNSQAFGLQLIATSRGMAIGEYNLKNDAAFVIGNGTSNTDRSDLFVIDHSGNVSAQGDISASGVSLVSFYTDYQTNSANFVTALPEDLVYTGDLNDYAKKDFVLSSIDSSTSGLLPTSSFSSVSGNFLTALPSDLVYTADITGLATTGDLANKLDTTAFSTVSGDFLTAHQDISDLMPKSESANFYPMTGNPSGFLTAHQDLSDYQTIEGMTAYQPVGEYYSASNPSGFICRVDLSSYVRNDTRWLEIGSDNYVEVINTATQNMVYDAFAFGSKNSASTTSVSFGSTNTSNNCSLAQGNRNSAYKNSFALGIQNFASGKNSENGSFAQGFKNSAYSGSFAQGSYNLASGCSFAQGNQCHASSYSIAQGAGVNASSYSQAFGIGTNSYNSGMAIGTYNETDSAAFVIGNGTAATARSDAFIVYHDGSVSAAGKISANGVELGAGGDVPEGVMVESGLEYNAVQEISGYNGSAIAQYGAEKQWLVHDDTLVHAANSAQYALGVNLSAVAQLLGVDETVLWSGTMSATGTTADFLDNVKDFEKIKVYTRRISNAVGRPYMINEFQPTYLPDNNQAFVYNQVVNIESNQHQEDCMYMVLYGNTNKWCLTGGWRLNGVTQTTGVTAYNFKIEKIVGIHRISG